MSDLDNNTASRRSLLLPLSRRKTWGCWKLSQSRLWLQHGRLSDLRSLPIKRTAGRVMLAEKRLQQPYSRLQRGCEDLHLKQPAELYPRYQGRHEWPFLDRNSEHPIRKHNQRRQRHIQARLLLQLLVRLASRTLLYPQ